MRADSPTSPSLLGRLKDVHDQASWNEFVDRYGPMVHKWCRRRGLQDADAADVVQEVVTRLVRAIRVFVYDPAQSGFRAYLRTVTKSELSDFFNKRARAGQGSGDTNIGRQLGEIPGPDAFAELANELDAEVERDLMQVALERVRNHPRLDPRTFEAFRQTAIVGLDAATTAATLGMSVNSVYVAKSRVMKLLKEEMKIVMQSGPD